MSDLDEAQVIAQQFYQRYDELAPDYGLPVLQDDEVAQRGLMTNVVRELLQLGVIVPGPRESREDG